MLPTRDQIERAAYDRWLRRHRAHGHDQADWVGSEHELTYLLNYETVVEYTLDSSSPVIVGGDAPARCRFCERTARHAKFSSRRPVVQGAADASLFSAEVCDECQADCRDPLVSDCSKLWKTLKAGLAVSAGLNREVDTVAVFKSLVTSALLIMPAAELAYFTDTLEWVNNPDHEYDAGLFAGSYCHVYDAPFLNGRSWASLARRIDDGAPFPYMVSFVSCDGIVVQISIPLCIRDHDLDGRNSSLPARAFAAGEGQHFREARPTVVRLVNRISQARVRQRPSLLVH